MKTIKYVLMGALLFGAAAPGMAQDDNKAVIEQVVSVIKAKPANLSDQVKDFGKKYKKTQRFSWPLDVHSLSRRIS